MGLGRRRTSRRRFPRRRGRWIWRWTIFPIRATTTGEWFWESGFDKHPIREAEGNPRLEPARGLRRVQRHEEPRRGRDKHRNAYLTWVAYIGGPRESRRLLGDVVLTQEDIVTKRDVPRRLRAHHLVDRPALSQAAIRGEVPGQSVHLRSRNSTSAVDRNYGYPVPYRCFYSRNIDNLFMAGRCISVTHEALGTVRVMKTCGMMGEVVGKAASVCVQRDCTPRNVYENYWPDLDQLLNLPGKASRKTVTSPITIPDDALPLAGPEGAPTGLDPAQLPGLVIDDKQATKTGNWTSGTGLKGYVGWNYLYASSSPENRIQFDFQAPGSGR